MNNPEDESAGKRSVLGRRLFIERADFGVSAWVKFSVSVLAVKCGCVTPIFTCQSVEKDAEGNITRLICTYDPETRGGKRPMAAR